MPESRRRALRVLSSEVSARNPVALLGPVLFGVLLVALGLRSAMGADSAPSGDPAAVYTDAQAEQGRQVYFRTCAVCHGENMDGKVGPALTGRQFHQMVAAQNMTAPALFQYIETQMPKTKPGSLAPADYAKIMAFILQQNGYPAGSKPLDDQGQGLEKINLAAMPKSSS